MAFFRWPMLISGVQLRRAQGNTEIFKQFRNHIELVPHLGFNVVSQVLLLLLVISDH